MKNIYQNNGLTINQLEERFEMVAAADSNVNIDTTVDTNTGTVSVGTHFNF
jgi:hypothetical protein